MGQQNTQSTQQAAVQQQPFDPEMPKRSYSSTEWTMKEDWYTKRTAELVIPASPTPAHVQNMAVEIDKLLSVARIDHAFVTQTANQYEMIYKIEEKRLFTEVQNMPENAGKKLTVGAIESLVANTMASKGWNNSNLTLVHLVNMTSSRRIFMNAVIKCLEDKKDLLITHSAVLKLENSLSALQGNAANG